MFALKNKIYDHIDKTHFGVFIIWLFHISAIIGVTLGYFDWFISKTPLNLLVTATVLFLFFPITSKKFFLSFIFFAAVGIFAEWLGVKYGFIFGDYVYGENLGYKIDDVPWLIGVNWAILIFITAKLAEEWVEAQWLRPVIGSLLMLVLDFFMEGVAPIFDFWTFKEGFAPLQNYIGWFCVAMVLQIVYLLLKLNGSFKISVHLYFCQLVFFMYFYLYFHMG